MLLRAMLDAGAVMKILVVVAAVVAAFVVLKIVLALVSALFGVLVFLGVLTLLGVGAYSVMRLLTRGSRSRSRV